MTVLLLPSIFGWRDLPCKVAWGIAALYMCTCSMRPVASANTHERHAAAFS